MREIELKSINDIFFCNEISSSSHEILSSVWKHLDSNDFYIQKIIISADRMYTEIRFEKKRWCVSYKISLIIMSDLNKNGMQSTLEHMKFDMLNYWEKSYADNQRITQVPN